LVVSEFTPQIHLDGVFTPFGIIKVASSTITIRQDTAVLNIKEIKAARELGEDLN
jgi:hypothetical protein